MSDIKWKIKQSPFEVYNVDHGEALTHHVVEGYTMIAALYVEPDSEKAHLIAAAPDLYQALKLCEKTVSHLVDEYPGYIGELRIIRDVLAKARGE